MYVLKCCVSSVHFRRSYCIYSYRIVIMLGPLTWPAPTAGTMSLPPSTSASSKELPNPPPLCLCDCEKRNV